MKLSIRTSKLRRDLESESRCTRKFGKANAEKIRIRLNVLRAAETLADFWPPNSGPERCHELKGDRQGVFSMDLKQPFRLLFVPVCIEYSTTADAREYWLKIEAIEIIGIEDTHG